MKKGRHRRFEEARALKQSNEVDVDAIFRIDELLETEDDGDVPPEHASWYEEFGSDAADPAGADPAGGEEPEAADASVDQAEPTED